MRKNILNRTGQALHVNGAAVAQWSIVCALTLMTVTFFCLPLSCNSDSQDVSGAGLQQAVNSRHIDASDGVYSESTSRQESFPLEGELYPGQPADFIITVGVVRFTGSGTLEYSVEDWTQSRFRGYLNSLEGCQTAEEALPILEQYGLAPEGLTFSELQDLLYDEVNGALPSGTSLEMMGTSVGSSCSEFEVCSGDGCVTCGKIEGPFYFSKSTPLYFSWVSFYGGYAGMACLNEGLCYCESDSFNAGLLVGGPMVYCPPLPDSSFVWLTEVWYGGMFAFSWAACGS